jgi:integrase
MLLILITYGVRRSQVVDLRLDDLDWRASTLRMPASKRGRRVVVPMTATVGDALVAYLRNARPTTVSRSIFLSMDPPFRR